MTSIKKWLKRLVCPHLRWTDRDIEAIWQHRANSLKVGRQDCAPHAICLAALKAVEYRKM